MLSSFYFKNLSTHVDTHRENHSKLLIPKNFREISLTFKNLKFVKKCTENSGRQHYSKTKNPFSEIAVNYRLTQKYCHLPIAQIDIGPRNHLLFTLIVIFKIRAAQNPEINPPNNKWKWKTTKSFLGEQGNLINTEKKKPQVGERKDPWDSGDKGNGGTKGELWSEGMGYCFWEYLIWERPRGDIDISNTCYM